MDSELAASSKMVSSLSVGQGIADMTVQKDGSKPQNRTAHPFEHVL